MMEVRPLHHIPNWRARLVIVKICNSKSMRRSAWNLRFPLGTPPTTVVVRCTLEETVTLNVRGRSWQLLSWLARLFVSLYWFGGRDVHWAMFLLTVFGSTLILGSFNCSNRAMRLTDVSLTWAYLVLHRYLHRWLSTFLSLSWSINGNRWNRHFRHALKGSAVVTNGSATLRRHSQSLLWSRHFLGLR